MTTSLTKKLEPVFYGIQKVLGDDIHSSGFLGDVEYAKAIVKTFVEQNAEIPALNGKEIETVTQALMQAPPGSTKHKRRRSVPAEYSSHFSSSSCPKPKQYKGAEESTVKTCIREIHDESESALRVYCDPDATETLLQKLDTDDDTDPSQVWEFLTQWTTRPWVSTDAMIALASARVGASQTETLATSGTRGSRKNKNLPAQSDWGKLLQEIGKIVLADKRANFDWQSACQYLDVLSECSSALLKSSKKRLNDKLLSNEKLEQEAEVLQSSTECIRCVLASFGFRLSHSKKTFSWVSSIYECMSSDIFSPQVQKIRNALEQSATLLILLKIQAEHFRLREAVKYPYQLTLHLDDICATLHCFYSGLAVSGDSSSHTVLSCCNIGEKLLTSLQRATVLFDNYNSSATTNVNHSVLLMKVSDHVFTTFVEGTITSHFTRLAAGGVYRLDAPAFFAVASCLRAIARVLKDVQTSLKGAEVPVSNTSVVEYIKQAADTLKRIRLFLDMCPLPTEALAWMHSMQKFSSLTTKQRRIINRILSIGKLVYPKHFGAAEKAKSSFEKTVGKNIAMFLVFDNDYVNHDSLEEGDLTVVAQLWNESCPAQEGQRGDSAEASEGLGSAPLFFTDLGDDHALGVENGGNDHQDARNALDEVLKSTEEPVHTKGQVDVDSGSEISDE